MTNASKPFDDVARIAALRRYGVLDDPDVGDLDGVLRVAQALCGTAGSSVNLIDSELTIIPASPVYGKMVIPREYTLCEVTIRAGEATYTKDVNSDPRWTGHAVVNPDKPLLRTHAAAPIITGDGHAIGTVCVTDLQQVDISPGQLKSLQDLADCVMQIFEARLQASKLRAALGELAVCSAHDTLTGVANRDQVLDFLEDLAANAVPHSVLFLDLDRFKAVNDLHGHAVGDRVLEAVGARLRAACRGGDLVGRIGGDEFVIVVRQPQAAVVESIAQRVSNLVQSEVLTVAGKLSVGVSIGWATWEAGQSAADLVERADRAMYETKARRRVA